jgi:cysteine synthase A
MTEPGGTPLIEIEGIYAKLECSNPCGSIKDRIAKYILEESERRGLLRPGMTIVEATSGNTGIALSYYAREKGYPITIVMPENMTEERKQFIRDLGAKLLLCSREGSFEEAAAIRDRIARQPGYFNPDQFSNPLNVECHYRTTGQEILDQMRPLAPTIDAFVAGVGTGGTLIGVGKRLKAENPRVHVAAVEPSESAVMSGGNPGLHGIAGIGDGFIPAIVQQESGELHECIDQVICIPSAAAKNAARHLEKKFGFCVGTSSGANFLAARQLAECFPNVVTVFPDGYVRYRSEGLVRSTEGRCEYEKKCTGSLIENI